LGGRNWWGRPTTRITLLDPTKYDEYDEYRLRYAAILYEWGLLKQRNEILKFVKVLPKDLIVGQKTGERAGIDFGIICPECKSESLPTRKHHYCIKCERKKFGAKCSICRCTVRGIYLIY